jgi:hypothetical protein
MLTSSEKQFLKAVVTNQPAIVPAKEAIRLRATVAYDVFGNTVDCLYLETAGGKPAFVFGWKVVGKNVYDLFQTITGFYDSFETGLKSIRSYHRWKIFLGSTPTWRDRVSDLTEMLENTTNTGAQQILIDTIARTQQTTLNGQRVDNTCDIYVTYFPDKDKFSGEEDDWIEAGTKEVKSFWDDCLRWCGNIIKIDIGGSAEKAAAERIETLFKSAYIRTYEEISTIFSGAMDLPVLPMSNEQLWARLRDRVSGFPSGESTYHVKCIIDSTGTHFVKERFIEEWAIADQLLKDAIPELEPHVVAMQRWNPEKPRWCPDNFNPQTDDYGEWELGDYEADYIGVLVAKRLNTMKNEFAQIHHWHRDLRSNPKMRGVEVCIEITASDSRIQQANAQDIFKQAQRRMKDAAKSGEYSASGVAESRQSAAALDAIYADGANVWISMVLLVHRPSLEELDLACADVIGRFKMAPLVREFSAAQHIWLRTLPCATDLMTNFSVAAVSVNCQHLYSTREAMAFLAFCHTTGLDGTRGIELVAQDRQPVYLDFFSPEATGHYTISAEQRYGKSYFGQMIAGFAVALGQPVTFFDQPPPDGRSAIRNLCRVYGGSYIEISNGDTSYNILQIPSHLLGSNSPLSSNEKQAQFNFLKEHWADILKIAIAPPTNETLLYKTSEKILNAAIALFIDNDRIRQRYKIAIDGGFSTEWDSPWKKMPTLKDFREFMKPEILQSKLQYMDGPVDTALKLMWTHLQEISDEKTTIGKTISRPSTVDVENTLLTAFSLEGISVDSNDGLFYCLAAYASAMQKALLYDISHIIYEELQDLIKHPGILRMAADSMTRGGKRGVRAGLITNSFTDVAESEAGNRILANLGTKIIGRISPATARSFSEHFRMPPEYFAPCTSFNTNRRDASTQWFVYNKDKSAYVNYLSPWVQAAVSGSNRPERDLLDRFIEMAERMNVPHPVNIALAAFSKLFMQCAKSGNMVYHIEDEVIEQLIQKCL